MDFKGVDESGGGYDGGAVLVVVHHGYVAFLFQTLLDFKTFGRFDILEVYAAECRSQRFHNLDKFFRVFLVDLDVETVEPGEYLEKQSLALHYRLSGKRADVAEAKHCGAVGDYGDEVALVGIFIGICRIFLNLQAGICYSGRVGECQVLH